MFMFSKLYIDTAKNKQKYFQKYFYTYVNKKKS